MQRYLIALGVILLVAGLLWPWISKLGLGRLPGVRFYFPITTGLVISAVVTLILWIFRK